MGSIGDTLMEAHPDEFGDRPPDEVTAFIIRNLDGDRPNAIAALRDRLPGLKDFSDDDVEAAVRKSSFKSTMSPEKMLQIQRMGRLKQGKGMYRDNVRNALVTQQSEIEAPERKERAAEHIRSSVTPMDAVKPRVPIAGRMEDMRVGPGQKLVNPHAGLGGFVVTPQAQDLAGNVVQQLEPGASYRASEIEGAPSFNLGRITGEGSELQQGIAETIGQAVGVRAPDPITPGEGMGRGYGLPELGEDLGARQGERHPATTKAMFDVASKAMSPVAAGLGAVDWLEEKALRGVDRVWPGQNTWAGRWAEENRQEKEGYWDAARRLAEGSRGIPESGAPELGRALGKTEGQIAQAIAPTEGSLGIPLVAGAVKYGAGKVAQPIARRLSQAYPEAFKQWGQVVSKVPERAGMTDEMAVAATGVEAAHRSAGDIYEQKLLERMMENARKASGIEDPDKLNAALRGALEAWHSPEARQALPAEWQKVFEALQPEQVAIARRALNVDASIPLAVKHKREIPGLVAEAEERTVKEAMPGESPDYVPAKATERQVNPFHVYYGQNPSKANTVKESEHLRQARLDKFVADVEMTKDVGAPMDVRRLEGVPGISPTTYDVSKDLARESRSFKDTVEQLERFGMRRDLAAGMAELNAASALAKSGRAVEESMGLAKAATLAEIEKAAPVFQKYKPTHGMSLDDYAQGGGVQGAPRVNVYREDIGGWSIDEKLARKMRENDDVLVLVPGQPMKGLPDADLIMDRGQRLIMRIDHPAAASLHGRVIDGRVARMYDQITNPGAAIKGARKFADTMDRALGLTGLNYVITRGNLGFEARNRVSEMWRMTVDDPTVMDARSRKLVEEVANARIGDATGRVIPELGMTAGQAHEALLRYGNIGHGVLTELRGVTPKVAGPSWMPQRVTNVLTAPAKVMEKVQDVAVNERIRQGLFASLPKRYQAEDGLRMLHMLHQMRRGVSAQQAGAAMKTLLIDYGDKAGIHYALKPFVPFIKYYTGAIKGAVGLAAKYPRRFARVYDLAKSMERWDTMQHGGQGINAKFKDEGDLLSGAPLVGEGGGITAIRPETTAAEVAGLLKTYRGGFVGDAETGERRMGTLAGPLLAVPYGLGTGKSLSTGRSLLGVSGDLQRALEEEGGSSLAGQMRAANRLQGSPGYFGEQPLGDSPKLKTLTTLLGTTGLVPPPVQMLGRMATGSSNPASRSEELAGAQLRRSLRSYTTGVRSSTIDPTVVLLQHQKKKAPKPLVKIGESAMKRGRGAAGGVE